MGESIFEGTITKWLKKAGDPVDKDEPLFEISTDKVDAEIPAPATGVLTEIRFPEGATVQINTVVAVVSETGEAVATPANFQVQTPPVPQEQLAAPQVPQGAGGTEVVMPQMGESIFEGTVTKWLKQVGDTVQKDEPLFEISTDKVDAEIPAPITGVLTEIRVPQGTTVEINKVVAVIGGALAPASGASGAGPATAEASATPSVAPQAQMAAPQVEQAPGRRVRSSPLVRRIAKENNLDLAYVPGTGSDGRITKEDILRYLSDVASGKMPASTRTAPQAQLAPPQVAQVPPMGSEVVALSRMRAIIAQRMVESKEISPHVHSVYKVDMTRIALLRERHKAAFEQRHGVKLTYMPFIAVAAIQALRRFPIVNASLQDGFIHYHPNINLGIAVALEWGLIVPVVKRAEEQSFVSLARAINDLAGRARTKKLMPEEVTESTFTLTNSGIFGDEFGTPIINQPESAILAIGGLRKEPVVLTDAEGNDSIAIRSMQHFCLGFDHRTIDGADSGKFMTEFKKTLEGWDREIG
jgi:2-oxoglutarate dehydrogenase E2 component (dihydrolipoamide succinyltransferase)